MQGLRFSIQNLLGNPEYAFKIRKYFDFLSLNFAERTQETDPRSEWRTLQEEMLRSYLASAETDLKAKQELIDVKHQRLNLAQDEYHHLSNTLSNLSASSTSCKTFYEFFKIVKNPSFLQKKNVSIFIAVSSPPMLHTGRKQVASCIHPVPIRPKAGLTLPVSGRQCYSAVTSPITSCKCSSQAASSSRPASTIPGLFLLNSSVYCVNSPIFCSHF